MASRDERPTSVDGEGPGGHGIRGLKLFFIIATALVLVSLPGRVEAIYSGPIMLDQPQVDTAAPNVPADKKVVTVGVRAVNASSQPFTVDPALLYLIDENENHYREPGTSSGPPLAKTVLAPGKSISGQVAFLVPAGMWPQGAGYEGLITVSWHVPVFTDVNDGHRFYKQIGELKYQGIVEGFSDGSFHPDTPILRQQLAKMLVLGAAAVADSYYSKVEGHPSQPAPALPYPWGYLKAAESAGYLPWSQAESAQALGTITRLELARALARIGQGALASPPSTYRLPFSDVLVSAVADVVLLAFNRILEGTGPAKFSPDALATRGQVARAIGLILRPQGRESLPPGVTTTTTAP